MSTLINPGTTPQVYTEDGRMVAAGERVEFDQLDEVGQTAVDAGRLRVLDEEPATPEPDSDANEGGDLLPDGDARSHRSSARRSRDTSS